jgi:hypothetical protein
MRHALETRSRSAGTVSLAPTVGHLEALAIWSFAPGFGTQGQRIQFSPSIAPSQVVCSHDRHEALARLPSRL